MGPENEASPLRGRAPMANANAERGAERNDQGSPAPATAPEDA